jgi:hypothetical protein
MADNATHPDVKAVVTAYALGRGRVTCATCADGYPSIIQEFAVSQDKIGWENFMMAMVLAKLFFIQKIAPPAMHATPIASEVGGRAGYTPTAGNPRSMDIAVPIGAQPHIRHDHQSL